MPDMTHTGPSVLYVRESINGSLSKTETIRVDVTPQLVENLLITIQHSLFGRATVERRIPIDPETLHILSDNLHKES